MKPILQFLGRLAYRCGWPAFWIYFRRDRGRTRVILERGDEVLFVKQWVGDGRWQLPGGGMHKGEPALVGAIRELAEETGVRLREDQLLPVGRAEYHSHGSVLTMHVFRAGWRGEALHLERIEIADAKWLRPDQLTPGNTRPDTLAALRMLQ